MNPDFDQNIRLSLCALSDLRWVIENVSHLNGFMFGNHPVDVYMECDARLAGWGAVCNVSRLNAKLDQFVSWHPEPGVLAVVVFSISWSN